MIEILETVKQQVAVKENLEECNIQSDFSSKKGDGFVGDIYRLILEGRHGNTKQKKRLFLILKSAPKEPVQRNCMPVKKMYENEFYAYETILPILEDIYKESNLQFIKYPKFYFKNNVEYNEFLVLEDLNQLEFKMWNNKLTMDDNHILLILDDLAKFHGSSMIVKQKFPDRWKELCDELNHVGCDFFGKSDYCDAIISQAKSLYGLFSKEHEAGILEKFMEFCQTDLKYFMGEFCSTFNENSVIAHGDLWCNNLLFKYEDSENPTKPTELAILDFQAMRLSSFAIDISNFFYVSATKETMDKIDDFLMFYYRKIEEILLQFGLDPQETFSYDAFMDEWKNYNRFGFAMALVVLHGISSEDSEFPNLTDIVRSGESFWFALNFVSKNEDIYRKKVKELIVHFYEKEYL